jgi:DNA helicase-2/ATP-dependent DNA helicase PcrA
MNKNLLRRVVELSNGQIPRFAAETVYKHSSDQFADPAAKRYAGVDLDKLETVDGGSLADEFIDDIAQTIDPEDFAIVYELRRLKFGIKRGDEEGLHQFSHILIDEAQDLAPIELAALGAALTREGSVTIAGDSAQQIDPSTTFDSWDAVLDQIGVPRVQAQHLTTTYRSPRPVAEFAHAILGKYAPREMPKAIKEGVPVTVTLCPNEGHLMLTLADTLSDLMVAEPLASVAVITRTAEHSLRIFKMLSDVPKARIVEDGAFDFAYCSHVLEHVSDPIKACTELMRVAKRGYLETPTRAKDLFLNTAKVSNHRWMVEWFNNRLVFSEYTHDQVEGLSSDILMSMHCAPPLHT